MGRRASREMAMKLLYQMEIQKEDREEQLSEAYEANSLNEKDRSYITDVVQGVFKNQQFIDALVMEYAKGWKLNRISKVDLSVLRLCIYELHYRHDIPWSVSVNEAVELAKKYSGEEAGSFVNGILGRITDTLEGK